MEREGAAREQLASETTRAVRIDAVDDEIARVEGELAQVIDELGRSERELEVAEQAFREAEQERHRVEELRRRAAESAAGRRAEIEALERSLASSERERERLAASLGSVRDRIAEADAERAGLEREIETFDDRSAPMNEKRVALESERRSLTGRIEELDDVRRRHEARHDLLEARRRDIEETAGSRFLSRRGRHAIGLLRDLVTVEPGLERALVAALGPLADAVVYDDGERALADAPEGDGAIFAITSGGPVPLGLAGERKLLSAVDAEPAARGIASTVLRDVYLASTVAEAAAKQRQHPAASFVTPEGVLVGPAVIHTAKEADARVREIRAELQVVAHDLSGNLEHPEADARAARRDRRRDRLPRRADRGGRHRDHRDRGTPRWGSSAISPGCAGRRSCSPIGSPPSTRRSRRRASAWPCSGRLRPTRRCPSFPRNPQPPMPARVSVETLRRDRSRHDARLATLRSERDELSAHHPVAVRAALEAAERERSDAETEVARAEGALPRRHALETPPRPRSVRSPSGKPV